MYPAENVTAVRPPGMNRATTMRYVPRCSSWCSAHANPLWLFSPEDALHGVLAEPGAEAVRDVVAGDRPRRRAEDHEREVEVARAGEHTGGDHHGLAGHEREERVDHGNREDREIRPVARDPLLELVEHREDLRPEGEGGGHGSILAETPLATTS
jgi:hypothetical protein